MSADFVVETRGKKLHPVAYASRALSTCTAEKKYTVMDLNTLVVV